MSRGYAGYTECMIAYLKGMVLEKTFTYLIIENSGIGYKVFVTPEMLETKLGGEVRVYIYQKVTDDGITLFGMPDFRNLQFFELLITVTGVGPKMALSMLSAAKPDILENAISNADTGMFTRMSGVGKKTAERIILELKTKVSSITMQQSKGSTEIYDALVGLGYSPREARDVTLQVDNTLPSDQQLKMALKLLRKS